MAMTLINNDLSFANLATFTAGQINIINTVSTTGDVIEYSFTTAVAQTGWDRQYIEVEIDDGTPRVEHVTMGPTPSFVRFARVAPETETSLRFRVVWRSQADGEVRPGAWSPVRVVTPSIGAPSVAIVSTHNRTEGTQYSGFYLRANASGFGTQHLPSDERFVQPFLQLSFHWEVVTGARTGNINAIPSPVAVDLRADHFRGPLFPIAATQAGTMTVRCTVTDGFTVVQQTIDLTVNDADAVFAGGNTVCWSLSGFSGAPAGSNHQTTLAGVQAALDALSGAGANIRLLYRAGEDFSELGQIDLPVGARVMVGSFGSGARPIVSRNLRFDSGTTVEATYADVESVGTYDPSDLNWSGGYSEGGNGVTYGSTAGGANYVMTFFNVKISNYENGISHGVGSGQGERPVVIANDLEIGACGNFGWLDGDTHYVGVNGFSYTPPVDGYHGSGYTTGPSRPNTPDHGAWRATRNDNGGWTCIGKYMVASFFSWSGNFNPAIRLFSNPDYASRDRVVCQVDGIEIGAACQIAQQSQDVRTTVCWRKESVDVFSVHASSVQQPIEFAPVAIINCSFRIGGQPRAFLENHSAFIKIGNNNGDYDNLFGVNRDAVRVYSNTVYNQRGSYGIANKPPLYLIEADNTNEVPSDVRVENNTYYWDHNFPNDPSNPMQNHDTASVLFSSTYPGMRRTASQSITGGAGGTLVGNDGWHKLTYTNGEVAVSTYASGTVIQGATSGAVGTVWRNQIEAGGFGTDDAQGYLMLTDVTGTFVAGEDIVPQGGGTRYMNAAGYELNGLDTGLAFRPQDLVTYEPQTGAAEIGAASSGLVSVEDRRGSIRRDVVAGLARSTPSQGQYEPAVNA